MKRPALVRLALLALLVPVALLSGCGSAPKRAPDTQATTPSRPGGYYKDDGPGDNPPANLAAIADAEPKAEPLHRFANNPYNALGQDFVPFRELRPYRERGTASWYGRRYHGQRTSSGETYDMYAMTAAHPVLPIPSYARVTNPANGRSVVVRINDRGPHYRGRSIDLSRGAAAKLGMIHPGTAPSASRCWATRLPTMSGRLPPGSASPSPGAGRSASSPRPVAGDIRARSRSASADRRPGSVPRSLRLE
jgi:rare lipoprotein A